MKNPRDYLSEIDANLRKIQSQGQVTPTENALFGMIDGLAGLQRTLLERVTILEERVGIVAAPAGGEVEEMPRATFPSPAQRKTAARRGRGVGTAGEYSVSTSPNPEAPPVTTPARGPDTRNATVNPDGVGAAPIPVETTRSRRGGGKSRPERPPTPGRSPGRRSSRS